MHAVVLSTTLVLAFSAVVTLTPAALAPLLASSLGLPSTLIGLQVSLVFIGGMAMSLVGGSLSRQLGACRTSQFALLLLGLGAVIAAFPSPWTFALASLLMGLGYGAVNPAGSALLSRYTPPGRHGLLFSIKQSGTPVGGMIAGFSAPPLAALIGWQGTLLLLGVIALVGMAMLEPYRETWDRDRVGGGPWLRDPLADLRLVWQHRALRYLSLAGMGFSCVQMTLSAFTVTLLVEDVRLALVTAGMIMAGVQFSGCAGRVLWGWIGDRLGNGRAVLVGVGLANIACALFTATIGADWPSAAVAALLCVFGLVAVGWNGIYTSEVARQAPPGQVGAASGGALVFNFAGVVVGLPALTALNVVIESYATVFLLAAGIAAAALLSVVLAYRGSLPARAEADARSGAGT